MDENDVLGADADEQGCVLYDAPRDSTLKESLLRDKARLESQLRDVNAALAVVETDPAKWHGLYKLLRAADHY